MVYGCCNRDTELKVGGLEFSHHSHTKSTQILNLREVPFDAEGWGEKNMGKSGVCRPL